MKFNEFRGVISSPLYKIFGPLNLKILKQFRIFVTYFVFKFLSSLIGGVILLDDLDHGNGSGSKDLLLLINDLNWMLRVGYV